jgi:hypothetical protein
MQTQFLIKENLQQFDAQNLINKYSLKFHSSRHLFSKYTHHCTDCSNINIEKYNVKKLNKKISQKTKFPFYNNKYVAGIKLLVLFYLR